MLGVPFDPLTCREAIARIEQMIRSRRPHYVVTANVDFLVQAQRDVELRRILIDADLVLCDGTPLVWASRCLGNGLPERVAGADLVPELLRVSAAHGHRVFLLGAGPGVAAAAAARLQAQHPQLRIVGHYAPPFSPLLGMNHADIAHRVREAKPDILLVSFGCPKQEKWIAMHHQALGVPVAIGVGATLDFIAGRMRRAPIWMRASGTEWIFRMLQEPRRLLGRYCTDLVHFLPAVGAEWWRLTRSAPASVRPHLVSAFDVPEWYSVDAGERLTRQSIEEDAEFWQSMLERTTHCLLDLSRLRSLDGTGVALLLRWRKRHRARHRHLILLDPSPAVRRSLERMGLTECFLTASDAMAASRQADELARQPMVERHSTTRSLAWCGEITAANAEDVWRMTSGHIEAFSAHHAELVIIDLSRVRFIDSAGAALMLRLKKWAGDRPVQILFTAPQPNVRNVLRLTRLDQLLLEGGQ